MPLAGVKEAAERNAKRNQPGADGGKPTVYLSLQDGDEATVRFLEEGADFKTFYVHRFERLTNGKWTVPCRDQSPEPSGSIGCPGCDNGLKRSFRFVINVIHRDAPKPKRNAEGRIERDAKKNIVFETETNSDGEVVYIIEPQVKVWEQGITVAETLDHLDAKYKGLTSRDFEITRRGATFNDTTYQVLPADDREPLSDADKELAAQRYDLNQLTQAPDYENYYSGDTSTHTESEQKPSNISFGRKSPFQRKDRTED